MKTEETALAADLSITRATWTEVPNENSAHLCFVPSQVSSIEMAQLSFAPHVVRRTADGRWGLADFQDELQQSKIDQVNITITVRIA